MGGRGRDDGDDYGDEFEPEPDDRPDVGRVHDPDRDDDVELLDDTWRQAHGGGGGSRWLILLLIIPVVAIVVLQLRPDSPKSSAPAPSSTSSTTSPTSSLASPTQGPHDTGPYVRTWRRTTGAQEEISRVVTNLGHPVLGVTGKWELFVRGEDSVTRVELARGWATTTKTRAFSQDDPVSFVVTSAGAFGFNMDGGGGFAVLDGHRAKRMSAADDGLGRFDVILPGPDPGHVWALGSDDDGRTAAVLLDSHLRPTHTTRPFPDNASPGLYLSGVSDGTGTPLVTTPGGTYALEKHGLRRITPGAVLGAGPTRWLVVECDDTNRCTDSVINRETGSRRSIHLRQPQDEGGNQPAGRISPDGSTMASVDFSGQGPTVYLTDLTSGARHWVGNLNMGGFIGTSGSMAWSPDSRWLFYVADTGEVTAVDARTRKAKVLDLGVDAPSQVAVRPAS